MAIKAIFTVATLFLLFSGLAAAQTVKSADEEISFIAFGHVYPDYIALEKSIDIINEENVDFVVFLGDSVIGSKPEKRTEFEEILKKISVPVYHVAGNHDKKTEEDLQVLFEDTSKLFYTITIKDQTFIFLDSILDWEDKNYDITDEQVSFLKKTIEADEINKYVMIHSCLFYKDNDKFCNSKGGIISKDSNWNSKAVPLLKEIPVFVGDVGESQPFFKYEENDVTYYGVGFARNEFNVPQTMLKVATGENLVVEPIIIEQDLTKISYEESFQRPEPTFKDKIRNKIVSNLLAFIVLDLAVIIALMLLCLFLFAQNQKRRKK